MSTKITHDIVYTHLVGRFSLSNEDSILLSVSGGLDSMVMLALFQELPFRIGVAHINHSTRQGASDEDQRFIEVYCSDRRIPFYTTTLDYSVLNEGNFQSNARDARYSFLENIRAEENYSYIATAHHLDDVWESMLMNIIRGSGIHGIQSIAPMNGTIIRPLLHHSREDLVAYQQLHNISYREDSSNASNLYDRNTIRNCITPTIKAQFPKLLSGVYKSTTLLKEQSDLLSYLVASIKKESLKTHGVYHHLDLSAIRESPSPVQLLYSIIHEAYGYTYQDAHDMLASMTGSKFYSSTHEALYNRESLVIRPLGYLQEAISIDVQQLGHVQIGALTIDVQIAETEHDDLPTLPASVLDGSLHIRTWKPGDYFCPQGMGGRRKKLKDFLNDLKLSSFEKESVLVAIADDTIVQVINHRNSHDLPTGHPRIVISSTLDVGKKP